MGRSRLRSLCWTLTTVAILTLVPSLAYGQVPHDDKVANVQVNLDALWVLVAGAMVFLMQGGFLALEAGSVRQKAASITALKNVVDWVVCVSMFFFVGWAIMFGHTAEGFGKLWGMDGFSLSMDTTDGHPIGPWIHFLFQLAFAGTAATIVSGALAERTGFVAYIVCTAVVTGLIYPVMGHWAWGNSYFTKQLTFLTQFGFIDFAGSTVVHSIGGWVALMGVIVVGPRLGRFGANGEVRPMEPHSLSLSALGVLILWFSWWGFNGGSTLALNDQVGPIINNTNIAASFGGLGAFAHAALFQGKEGITTKFLGGVLAGLVGITANCYCVTPLFAVVIGVTSGVICNLATDLLLKWKLDDPVGAIPVHLACGMWGTLCVGLFGKTEMFPNGHTRLEQIGVQLMGIAVNAVWCCAVAFTMFVLLKKFVGLRVSAMEETFGYDLGGAIKHEPEQVDEQTLKQLMTQ